MFDPVTLAGTAAIAEGVKFVYGQVSEILKRRRERGQATAPIEAPGTTTSNSSAVDGTLVAARVDEQQLEQMRPALTALSKALMDVADGEPVTDEARLRADLAQARALLEVLYGQHVTFVGETGRPTTGTPVPPQAAEQVMTQVQHLTASGTGAVAVGTNTGQIATGGGMAAGGNISAGTPASNGTSD